MGCLDAGAGRAGLATDADRLGPQVDTLVGGATRYPPDRRLLNHLASQREHLFAFLRVPSVQATNWRAEQAIRPAVVTGKSWGGNRTRAGVDTRQLLTGVLLREAGQRPSDRVGQCRRNSRLIILRIASWLAAK